MKLHRLMGMTALCASLAASVGAQTTTVTQGTVFRNVTVVSTVDGSLAAGMAVIIDGATIVGVVPDASVQVADGVTSIDGTGHFMVPGYQDMHAHGVVTQSGAAPAEGDDHVHPEPSNQQDYWTMFLANGVTGFRQMNGSEEIMHIARDTNAASMAGETLAPEILQVTGDSFRGQARTPEEGIAFVQARVADGSDFLKMLGGRPDIVMAMLTEAAAQGLPVAGHLVAALETGAVSSVGWSTIEHLGAGLGVALDCAAAAPMIRARMAENAGPPPQFPPTFVLTPLLYTGMMAAPGYGAVLGSFNPEACAALVQTLNDNGTWQVPTLIRLQTMYQAGSDARRNDPTLRYLDPENRALWEGLGAEFAATIPAEVQALFNQYYAMQQSLTRMMVGAGTQIMAGSDVGGIWLLPGFALHEEFVELNTAGMSPLQVLQATTANPARYLGREATMGRVAAGFEADLVLLSANPLDDVSNLAAIDGVMVNGRFMDRATLDAMLADIEARNADG